MADLLHIRNFSLSFPHKVCFDNFSASISQGDRIAIIGRNGCGKSSLIKAIAQMDANVATAYIPQIITDFDTYSGGEKFNRALSIALGSSPDLMLLDEPTNHLDRHNRSGLLRKLMSYGGTLVVVTHDREILRNCVHILWHIDNGKVTIFRGKYDDYMKELQTKHRSLTHQVDLLKYQEQDAHRSLMKEQERAAKSKAAGQKKVANRRWMKSVGDMKAMKAEVSQGSKLKAIAKKKQDLIGQLEQIHLPKVIVPRFNLSAQKVAKGTVMSICDGAVGYGDTFIWNNINLSVHSSERVALTGRNGSGKTTLIRGILNDPKVIKTGNWNSPPLEDIGILDQHYETLSPDKSALEIISEVAPQWSHAEIRCHLGDFLFRKNEEISEAVKNLSGGERARLSLAQICSSSTQTSHLGRDYQ
ncbi:MAG: ATP-binding cassette domain-containing protein [Puniceicoccales bacterium]|jgi:ATPase subunit of ABC transporter with duplicated ATPase domains|nr:ATP-binding cassette domain-containing protein [Puniceicoccales bacterium]